MSKLVLDLLLQDDYDRSAMTEIVRSLCNQLNQLSEGKSTARYNAQVSVPTGSVAGAVGDVIWDASVTVRTSIAPGISSSYVRLGWIVTTSGNPPTYQEIRALTGASGTTPGEYQSSQVTAGAATSLANATAANVTTLNLTAGDWDVWGQVDYVLTGASTTDFKSGISSTSATFGAQDTFTNLPLILTLLSDTLGHSVTGSRMSLSSTTTIYLLGQSTFSAGTAKAYGTLIARRRP